MIGGAGMRRHLVVGEMVVGAGIIILSLGILPLWAAIVGLAIFAMGIGGLPLTSQVSGSDSSLHAGAGVAVVLLLAGVVAWLVWPAQKSDNVAAVTSSGVPPPVEIVPELAVEPKPAPEPKPTAKPASESRPGAVLARFSAKHKHRLRDCEGILTFTAKTIRFQSEEPDDSFAYSIDQVELDNDGVKDRLGKAWHFTVEGRDMEDVFKRWKAGALRAQK
jgi:hypothetical protein